MRQPCHRLRFARACRVLNQVVMACAFGLGQIHELTYSPQLVETREEGRLLFVSDLHLIRLDEMLDDVEQAVRLPDVAPQICSGVVAFDDGIHAVLVEGQKLRFFALQARRHKGVVVIHRKMHEASLQEGVVRLAVCPVLADAVHIVLVGELILQLRRDDRQSIAEDDQVDAVLAVGCCCRIAHLPHHRKAVGLIQQVRLRAFGSHFILEGHKPNLGAFDLDAFLQHVQHPLVGKGAVIHTHHLVQGTCAVFLRQLRPCLRLGFHEVLQLTSVAQAFDVKVLVVALAVHRATSQTFRDVLFKAFLSQSVHNCMVYLYLFSAKLILIGSVLLNVFNKLSSCPSQSQ